MSAEIRSKEDRIRERAYLIWEREGYQHGRDVEYWVRAENEITAEDNLISAKKSIGGASRAKAGTKRIQNLGTKVVLRVAKRK